MKQLVIRSVVLAFALGVLTAAPALAQATGPQSCDPVIRQLRVALGQCEQLARNHACYGNRRSAAQPDPPLRFFIPTDRLPVISASTIDAYRPAGAVIMYLTPDDSAPIKAALLGDAGLTPEDHNPALLTLVTRGDELLCERTKPGLLIQTDDERTGHVVVNGIDITLASALYLTTDGPDTMNVDVIRGQANVTIPGAVPEVRTVPAGWRVRIQGLATDQPSFAGPLARSPLVDSPVLQFLTGSSGLAIVSDPNSVPDPDIPPCGGEIKFGEPIFARNYVPGQECLYWFCADKGEIVTVDLQAAEGPLNTWIDLWGPGMNLIRWNNDISRSNTNSLVCNQPLPETGCYNIVARPNRNETIGSFRLTLSGRTSCAHPEARCEVVTTYGLNLRTGPGPTYPRILTLPSGTRLSPDEWSTDDGWVYVQAIDLAREGWVSTDVSLLRCEPPYEQIGDLEPDNDPDTVCIKCTPWSGYGP